MGLQPTFADFEYDGDHVRRDGDNRLKLGAALIH